MTHVGLAEGSRMPKLDASELAGLLAEYGRRSSFRGGNPYRAKAYIRAAENLAALTEPLDGIVDEGRLQEVPGVGASIADIISTAPGPTPR
jgi:DNA polymerase (family 10)